jgi:selT/selW/selH-like putative selenoprotein
VDSELVRAGRGVFEVRVNDEVIFSKRESHRFPEPDEIINLIKSRCASPSVITHPQGPGC